MTTSNAPQESPLSEKGVAKHDSQVSAPLFEEGGAKRRGVLSIVCAAVLFASIAALFHFFGSEGVDSFGGDGSLFRWLFVQYKHPQLQFTWIMPLVGLYAVWDRRQELAAAPKSTSLLGVLFVAAMLGAHALAFRAEQPRASLFAMAFAIWGSCWALWGRRVAYMLLFPLGYTLLSFLCYHITNYTTSLQVFASKLSVFFLRGFGLDASNVGSVIRVLIAGDPTPLVFNVADGCSGLRSLVVLSALAAPYAYFRIRGNLRAWILFAMSLPLAIFTNILRISSLTLFAHLFGRELSLQVYHDPAGFLVFFIAILLLQATGAFLERDWCGILRRFLAQLRRRGHTAVDNDPEPAIDGGQTPPTPAGSAAVNGHRPPSPTAQLSTAVALLALVGVTAFVLSRPRHFTGNPEAPVDFALPAELGSFTGDEVLFCTNDQCFRDYKRGEFPADATTFSCPVCSNALDTISIGERNLLPPGTPIIRRVYTAKDVPPVQISTVFAGTDRGAIHRPMGCLTAQGHDVVDQHRHTVRLPDGRTRTLDVIDSIRHYKNDVGRTISTGHLYAYWFFNPERETPSFFERTIWTSADSVLRSYRPRWAYISISIVCDPSNRDPAYRIVDELVTLLDPIVTDYQKRTKAAEQTPSAISRIHAQ